MQGARTSFTHLHLRNVGGTSGAEPALYQENSGTDYSFPNFGNWGMSSLSPNFPTAPPHASYRTSKRRMDRAEPLDSSTSRMTEQRQGFSVAGSK